MADRHPVAGRRPDTRTARLAHIRLLTTADEAELPLSHHRRFGRHRHCLGHLRLSRGDQAERRGTSYRRFRHFSSGKIDRTSLTLRWSSLAPSQPSSKVVIAKTPDCMSCGAFPLYIRAVSKPG